MSIADKQNVDSYNQIRCNPKFIALSRSRSKLSWLLTFIVLGTYCAYMLLAAYTPQLLHIPLYLGSHLTVGIPMGTFIIIAAWGLTGWYVHRCNTRFDALNAEIIAEVIS